MVVVVVAAVAVVVVVGVVAIVVAQQLRSSGSCSSCCCSSRKNTCEFGLGMNPGTIPFNLRVNVSALPLGDPEATFYAALVKRLRSWAGQTSGHGVSVMCGGFSPDAVWTPASDTLAIRPSLHIPTCFMLLLVLLLCLPLPLLRGSAGAGRLRVMGLL